MRSLSVLKNLPADPGFTDKRNGAQNQFENSDFLISAQKKHIFSMLAISKYVYVYIYIFFFSLLATHFYHYRNFETSFFMVNDKK